MSKTFFFVKRKGGLTLKYSWVAVNGGIDHWP